MEKLPIVLAMIVALPLLEVVLRGIGTMIQGVLDIVDIAKQKEG